MEKRIEFTPGYDKRNSDPSKNYGIHGMNIKFVLIGEFGATQFLIYTNWYPSHVTKDFIKKAQENQEKIWYECVFLPVGADVGYHSKKAFHEDQYKNEDCPYTNGICYYDGSGMAAENLMNKFLVHGDEAVWKELEEVYVDRFGELK